MAEDSPTPSGQTDEPMPPALPESAPDEGAFELDRAPERGTVGGGSGGGEARQSLLTLADDTCPNCHAKLEPEAVVCFACGYDLRTRQVVRPKVGTVEVEPDPKVVEAGKPEFVTEGRGSAGLIAGVGGLVVLVALATAAASLPVKSFGTVFGSSLLVVQQCVLHTGTGLVGVWIAAKVVGERFERNVDLGAARMFLAFAAFTAVRVLRPFADSPALSQFTMIVPAAALYWLTLFAVFRKSRQQTTVLAVSHLGVWMFIEFGVQLQVMVQEAIARK
jgi:ribosomal protein L40E